MSFKKIKPFDLEFPETFKLLEKARLEDAVFPSFSVGLYHEGIFFRSEANASSKDIFDLASLTKVLCTTTLTAVLLDKNSDIFSLNDNVQKYIPQFKDQRVTIAHLLNHTSGLPAWLPLHTHFHQKIPSPEEAKMFYLNEILNSLPSPNSDFEKKPIYSDLGFMLLGWILEEKFNAPLEKLFKENIQKIFKTPSLQFNPKTANVIETEDCPWRKHLLRGIVHDDNCYVLGGIAGHAGLFGNVTDVVELGKVWLDALNENTHSLHQIFSIFWNKTLGPKGSRVLGWDVVSPENSSAGKYFSTETRGHLGFTGTSLWIDPKQKLIVSLLTNRVSPSRTNEKIKEFRPVFHNTLLSEIFGK